MAWEFPGPVPAAALEFLRAKDLRPSFSYLDVAAEEHAVAFAVAKAAKLDILRDIRQALDKSIEAGGTFEAFAQDLEPVLREHGWWGEKEVERSDGKRVRAQLGSPARLHTIWDSNVRSARAAGQWSRIQRARKTHPYLLYGLGPSKHHRAEHVKLAGTLLPADDPFWRRMFPPNGYGCKCNVRQVTAREAERLGGVRRPPEGIEPDPQWSGNPGLDRQPALREILQAKIDSADEVAPGLRAAAEREAERLAD